MEHLNEKQFTEYEGVYNQITRLMNDLKVSEKVSTYFNFSDAIFQMDNPIDKQFMEKVSPLCRCNCCGA